MFDRVLYDFNINQTIIFGLDNLLAQKTIIVKYNKSTRQNIDDVMTDLYKNSDYNVIYHLFHRIITYMYTNIFII